MYYQGIAILSASQTFNPQLYEPYVLQAAELIMFWLSTKAKIRVSEVPLIEYYQFFSDINFVI